MLSNISLFKSYKKNSSNMKDPIKIMVVGEKFVGKTTLINNLHNMTGVNLECYEVLYSDTFSTISYLYFDNTDIVLLVFDIMNADSFRYVINEWYKNIMKYNKNTREIGFFLIANKSDLIVSEIDKLRPNDPKDYSMENHISFYLINHNDKENYNILKKDIIDKSLNIIKKNIKKNGNNIDNSTNKKQLEGLFNEIYGNKWKTDKDTLDIYYNIMNTNQNTNSFTNLYGESYYNIYNNSVNNCIII
jgi:GTPase SAR1 family protein